MCNYISQIPNGFQIRSLTVHFLLVWSSSCCSKSAVTTIQWHYWHISILLFLFPKIYLPILTLLRHPFQFLVYLILCCGITLTCLYTLLVPGRGLPPSPTLQIHLCPDCRVKLPAPFFPSAHSSCSFQLLIPSPDPIPSPPIHSPVLETLFCPTQSSHMCVSSGFL